MQAWSLWRWFWSTAATTANWWSLHWTSSSTTCSHHMALICMALSRPPSTSSIAYSISTWPSCSPSSRCHCACWWVLTRLTPASDCRWNAAVLQSGVLSMLSIPSMQFPVCILQYVLLPCRSDITGAQLETPLSARLREIKTTCMFALEGREAGRPSVPTFKHPAWTLADCSTHWYTN